MLRHKDGKRPERTSKIDGYMYTLKAVSADYPAIMSQAKDINRANGKAQRFWSTGVLDYEWWWDETMRGAPARIKPATEAQAERWAELSAWRFNDRRDFYIHRPYLLWVKAE